MKMKLKITAGELPVLYCLMGAAFVKLPIERLKENPVQYCAMGSLYEVMQKVRLKKDNDSIFKAYKHDKPITIILTRPQALAFDVIFNVQDTCLKEELTKGTYAWDLVRRICEQIYLTYYA